jgi:hypothetical protein
MKYIDIVNYNEVFLILAFIVLMIMAPAKLSPSYATSLIPSQVNPEPQQDKIKQIVDTNAFSNLSRNMSSSTGDTGQSLLSNATDTTTSVSSKSSALAAGGNSNSTDKGGSAPGGGSKSASGSSLKSIHNGSSGSRSHHANSGSSSSKSGSLSTSSSSSG